MPLPPLTPEQIVAKVLGYLRARNHEIEQGVVRFCDAQGFNVGYLLDCLIHHFEAGRNVYQKWKPDGSALLPPCVMQLNLELPDTRLGEAYLQLAIVKRAREMLLVVQIHGHTTIPLPR